ncbi:negative regulation of ubiquitin-protein transferase activity, variant 2 [Trifolium repens]|nr:negative regulation of ubiquitin-protein transferase activity, variant 2 [Trifolium repens]
MNSGPFPSVGSGDGVVTVSNNDRIRISYFGEEAILNCIGTTEKVIAQELMKLKRIQSAKKEVREKRVSTLMAEVKKILENS